MFEYVFRLFTVEVVVVSPHTGNVYTDKIDVRAASPESAIVQAATTCTRYGEEVIEVAIKD